MAKCRVFAIDHDLKEVVHDGLYTKHLNGENVSVSVVKFVAAKGADLPAKAHSHGEEASLQLFGACTVFEGEGEPGDRQTPMEAGSAMIIPVRQAHYGSNRFGPEGISLRLNIVSPPRAEFGPEDSAPYYPLRNREVQS